MGSKQHLKIVRQGTAAWNKWRKAHPNILPDLGEANLRGTNLCEADLSRTLLIWADLRRANLRKANLNRALLGSANLRGADLRRAKLHKADLTGADLHKADLSGTLLVWADLHRANLHTTNLSGARLGSANLRGADLRRAKLRKADLTGADLSRAALGGTDLTQALVGRTTFGDVDLSMAKGLDTVKHLAPSTIGIDTIYRSKGNIPEVFLRGIGIPDDSITYVDSLVGKAILFFSCFMSYSSKDKGFCDRLYADLQSNGVRTWYFPEDAKWGELVWGEIDRGIKTYDRVIVVCSKNSLQSGPVLREIERGLRREDRERKNVLFPIAIDNYVFDEWEHERKTDVLSKVVGDFRGWNRSTAKYEAAFKKLLEALKAESPKS